MQPVRPITEHLRETLKAFIEDELKAKIMTLYEAWHAYEPFIYDRAIGAFQCEPSLHIVVLCRLYSIHLGDDTWGSHENADRFLLATPGTCFRSSVTSFVTTGKPANLNRTEKRVIGVGNIFYVES